MRFLLLSKQLPVNFQENIMSPTLPNRGYFLSDSCSGSKGYSGRKTLVIFKEVILEIQADLASQLEESGAQLVVDFEVEFFSYTRMNRRSILYNLLIYAIKYRSPERVPKILVRTNE